MPICVCACVFGGVKIREVGCVAQMREWEAKIRGMGGRLGVSKGLKVRGVKIGACAGLLGES